MKFSLVILAFTLLSSCSTYDLTYNKKIPYTSTGFALIYNENDYQNKIVSSKFDPNIPVLAHNILPTGKLIKIMNPKNNKFVVLKNKKKIKYPSFYKIMITPALQKKLDLNVDFPFVDLEVLKKNKSFIAKKATTFNEEKNIFGKVPVEKVQINNLSQDNIVNSQKKYVFSILIAEFYSKKTANFLKKRLIEDSSNFTSKNLSIYTNKKNNYQVLSGPYKSINLIKNDYIELEKLGFEDLNIKIK